MVEFYSPYFSWTTEQAKDVRKLMDDLGIRCNSTHNGMNCVHGRRHREGDRAEQDSRSEVHRAGERRPGERERRLEDASRETLTKAAEQFRAAGLRAGYHNHKPEFVPVDGKRPMDILAANTPKDFMLQFDVGTCVEGGQDPVAWINANPGPDQQPAPEGLGARAKGTRFCSAKANRRGRRSSTPRSRRAGSNTT